ncbi:MAG: hypothetical protein COV10_00845 [Candidatus Vogelbacteria bacterium CG10_big_fil_rev_8_21_14_0_10_51_16]|uniref:Uncharacterized protein n=1 Tax=Candidatus Vogelbacteria bacterium CG10_big_fil_rev_8_21_14_0_10_51_16 TaxID=1975045 RepID=A0A2H0RFC1_9BACT|nr:MAG: hypothetical protein COV10_00845 [Candidatus Vogelbacteria bacterium CG10_big_fil_rev_8_21_14_0_10_51_16]
MSTIDIVTEGPSEQGEKPEQPKYNQAPPPRSRAELLNDLQNIDTAISECMDQIESINKRLRPFLMERASLQQELDARFVQDKERLQREYTDARRYLTALRNQLPQEDASKQTPAGRSPQETLQTAEDRFQEIRNNLIDSVGLREYVETCYRPRLAFVTLTHPKQNEATRKEMLTKYPELGAALSSVSDEQREEFFSAIASGKNSACMEWVGQYEQYEEMLLSNQPSVAQQNMTSAENSYQDAMLDIDNHVQKVLEVAQSGNKQELEDEIYVLASIL